MELSDKDVRYARTIQIDRLIVHILDNRPPGRLFLSQRELPLEGSPEIVNYFSSHIKNSLKDPAAKAAEFRKEDADRRRASPPIAEGICRAILSGTKDLVSGSVELATALHNIISKDQRISPGDLAFCLYKLDDHPQSFLAIMKLDPSSVYRHITEKDADGRIFVSFKLEEEVMPTTREKLQKCAFILPKVPTLSYDMLLLDRQIKQLADLPAAKFFIEDFLDAKQSFDPKTNTKNFYLGLMSAISKLSESGELTPDQALAMEKNADSAIRNKFINRKEWLSNMLLPEATKKKVDDIISKKVKDPALELDPGYAETLKRVLRWRGDRDLLVEAPAEFWADVLIDPPFSKLPGKSEYREIVILTKEWRRIV
jgi:nucleoid-associated protein YejK